MAKRKYWTIHDIEPEHILSTYHSGDKMVLCLDDCEEVKTTARFYEIEKILPEDEFVIIRKGIALRKSAIAAISDDGIYTMMDGRTYKGTTRSLAAHKRIRKALGLLKELPPPPPGWIDEETMMPLTLLEKCTLVEDMPVAYCIIELVFDENGHGIDFIFRYCNKHMAVVEGVPVEDMVNHSFYEVFKNGDRKWLVAYADVALNGVPHTLHDFSPEIGKQLTIHCYQPEPGYCSCILLPEEVKAESEEEEDTEEGDMQEAEKHIKQ